MTQVGTQLYIAPEVVRGDRYDEKCDIYSFAVVLLAMLELAPDVLDVFAQALGTVEKTEVGINEANLKEPEHVEASEACNKCPLNPTYIQGDASVRAQHLSNEDVTCPLAKHQAFKGVVAHKVTRAVVYDDRRLVQRSLPCVFVIVFFFTVWR